MEKRDKNTGVRTSEQSIQQSPEKKSMWIGKRSKKKKNARKHLMTHLQYVILKRVDSIMFDFSCALDFAAFLCALSLSHSTPRYQFILVYFLPIAPTGYKQQMDRMSTTVEQYPSLYPSVHVREMGYVIVDWFAAVSIVIW